MMMRGATTLKALAVLVTITGLAIMVAWYGFLEPPFLSYPDGSRFEVVRDVVRAGENVLLKVRRCNSSSEEEGYFIAARLIRLDPPAGQAPRPIIVPSGGMVPIDPGCTEVESAATLVPPTTEPGTYAIRAISLVPGFWRQKKIPWTSGPFRVVPAAAPAPPP